MDEKDRQDLELEDILKEKFIRQDDRESTNEIGKILKGKRIYIDDFYYDDNYMNYSEEVIVRIRASKDMILFSKMLVILGNLNNRSSAFKLLDNILEDMISEDRVRYDNHIRDLRMNMMFNSNYLDFDEAFDFLEVATYTAASERIILPSGIPTTFTA